MTSLCAQNAESSLYECAVLDDMPVRQKAVALVRQANNIHIPEPTPRNSTEIGTNATLFMTSETDSSALLVGDRLF